MVTILSRLNIPKERRIFYSIMFFVITAFVIYFNSLHGEFIGDDESLIEKNIAIHHCSFENIRNIFVHSFFDIINPSLGRPIGMMGGGYYRPLTLLSYLLDYMVWKNTPFGYHLTNIVLHIISVVFVFLLLRLMTHKIYFSFIVATIFLIHPMHSRHVASIAGRTDLLCLVFFLLSLILYCVYVRTHTAITKNIYIAGSFISFFCALLSKEMALTLPVIIVLYDICFGKVYSMRTFVRQSGTYAAYILILVLYLHIRRSILDVGLGYFVPLAVSYNPYLRILTCGGILVSLLQEAFFPYRLYYAWRYVPLVTSYWGKDFWVLCILCSIIFISIYASWRKDKVVFFGIGWFFITYFPVSNVVPLWPSIAQYTLFVGKQFLHIPLVGLCIALIALIFYITSRIKRLFLRTLLIWFFIMTVFTFSILTIYYNIAWSNPFYYNEKLLEQMPHSVDARVGLGIAYFRQGSIEKAVTLFNEAIAIQELQGPRIKLTPLPYQNLISIYYHVLGRFDKVRSLCTRGLNMFPNYYVFYY